MRPSVEKFNFKKSSKQDSQIFSFFQTFGEALTAENIEAIAKCFAIPSYIMGDRMAVALNGSEDVERIFSGTKKEYAKRGISEARPEVLRIQWLTDQIVVVNVRWPYRDRSGKEFGDESSAYTLKIDKNARLKIHSVIMLGENLTDFSPSH